MSKGFETFFNAAQALVDGEKADIIDEFRDSNTTRWTAPARDFQHRGIKDGPPDDECSHEFQHKGKARGSLTTPTREPFKQSLKSKMRSVVKRIIYIIRWERAYEEHRNSVMKGELKGAARHVEHKSVLSRLLKLSLTVQPANRSPQLINMLRPYVSRLKCCETLNSTVRSQLPTIVEYECFGKGRTIVRQGHPGESYYLIVSGSVDVVIDSEGGHSKYVNELTTGQGFGEVALVNKGPRTASIITREPTELLRIDRTQFHEVLRASKLQEMARKQGFLRTHPCFQELPEEILKKFVDNALIKSYKASDMIIRSGDVKLDHVIIVMSGECHVETPVMLNYYKLNGGKFLLDLPTVKRPDISRIRSQVSLSSDSSSRITCSTMSDHPAPVLSTQSLSPYGKYFQNDVEEVSQKKYHLCLRRIKAREYFSASDCISANGCNVGSIKKTECLLLPKILFQKHNMSKMLEGMTEIEEVNTLTVEEAFDSFLKRRHWEIYKKNLVSDVMKAKATRHKQSSVANSYSYR